MVQNHREPGARPGAAALHCPLSDTEQSGGIGYGITLHVDGNNGSALFDRELHQGAAHHDGGVNLRRAVRNRARVVDRDVRSVPPAAAELIAACVQDDSMQPATDGRVVPNGSRVSVSREQRVLHRFARVLGAAAGATRDPVEPAVVTGYQLSECVPISLHMCRQQLRVSAEIRGAGQLGRTRVAVHARTVAPPRCAGTSAKSGL